MSEDSAFVKGGRDVFVESSGVFWWFLVLTIIYVVLLFVQWVTILNIDVPHTYFSNPGAPGTLFSLRYSSFPAIALELMSTRIFFVVAILCLLIFRHSRNWNLFWIIVLLILFALQTFVVVGLSVEYARHSGDGQRYNLASDPWFCCAPERHANPLNGCVNALPCGSPVPPGFSASDLRPKESFEALYWVNFFLFLLDVFWVAWILAMWVAPLESFVLDRGEPKEEGGEEEMFVPSAPEPEEIELKEKIQSKSHGLRKRG